MLLYAHKTKLNQAQIPKNVENNGYNNYLHQTNSWKQSFCWDLSDGGIASV